MWQSYQAYWSTSQFCNYHKTPKIEHQSINMENFTVAKMIIPVTKSDRPLPITSVESLGNALYSSMSKCLSFSRTVVLKLELHQNPVEGLLKSRSLAPAWVSDSGRMGWGPKLFISNRFPGRARAAAGTALWEPPPRVSALSLAPVWSCDLPRPSGAHSSSCWPCWQLVAHNRVPPRNCPPSKEATLSRFHAPVHGQPTAGDWSTCGSQVLASIQDTLKGHPISELPWGPVRTQLPLLPNPLSYTPLGQLVPTQICRISITKQLVCLWT